MSNAQYERCGVTRVHTQNRSAEISALSGRAPLKSDGKVIAAAAATDPCSPLRSRALHSCASTVVSAPISTLSWAT